MKFAISPGTNPQDALRSIFLERRGRNAAYSMRAFARDLGMSQALMSLILSGKRPLTLKQAARISVMLGLPQKESEALVEAVVKKPGKPFVNLELEAFKMIGQWYHVAILDLTTTKGFKSDPVWIADRLGIGVLEARDAIERLIKLELLMRDRAGRISKPKEKVYFPTTRSRAPIRAFHTQMITKALEQLTDARPEAFERREISAITMAIPASAVAKARARIQAFQKELAAELTVGDCDEVYQLNVQFFPLTREQRNSRSKKS